MGGPSLRQTLPGRFPGDSTGHSTWVVRSLSVRRRGGRRLPCRWRSGPGGRGTGCGRQGWAAGGKKLQDLLVDRKVARERAGFGASGRRWRRPDCVGCGAGRGRGFSRHGALTRRDTLESKAVRRPRLNSTLKSLLFWMVLVVVGVLIWNFSHTFQQEPRGQIPFSTFLEQRRRTSKVAKVTDHRATRSRERSPVTSGNGSEQFRTYAPTQYEGLAQPAPRQEGRDRQPRSRPPARGRRSSTPGRRSSS